mgnify:CR=1 FL=1
MINGKSVLAIIPAREGSKRIPGKNIKMLGDKPLIAWTIKAAERSEYIDRLIVSTDSNKIAKVAKDWGIEVPFIRPPHLATDEASSEDVILHAIEYLKQNETLEYDYLILLQPTSPFRTNIHIDEAINKLVSSADGDSLVGVCDNKQGSTKKLKDLTGRNEHSTYVVNGSIYICKTKIFIEDHSFYKSNCLKFSMSKESSLDIDTENDWVISNKIK